MSDGRLPRVLMSKEKLVRALREGLLARPRTEEEKETLSPMRPMTTDADFQEAARILARTIGWKMDAYEGANGIVTFLIRGLGRPTDLETVRAALLAVAPRGRPVFVL